MSRDNPSNKDDEKSSFDVLSGHVTICDFREQICEMLPIFHNYVLQQRETVHSSIVQLHELTHMPGKPIDGSMESSNNKELNEYLHSLLLAITVHKDKIEALYQSVDD